MSVPRPAMFVAIVTVPALAGLGDDLGLLLVLPGVEHLVLDRRPLSASARQLLDFSTERVPISTGRPGSVQPLHLLDDRVELRVLASGRRGRAGARG